MTFLQRVLVFSLVVLMCSSAATGSLNPKLDGSVPLQEQADQATGPVTFGLVGRGAGDRSSVAASSGSRTTPVFCFGSNGAEQLKERLKGVDLSDNIVARPALLDDYERIFAGSGSWRNGAVASVAPRDGAKVLGSLVDLTEKQVERLDEFEGHPFVYKRQEITVRSWPVWSKTADVGQHFKQERALVYIKNNSKWIREPSGYGEQGWPTSDVVGRLRMARETGFYLAAVALNIRQFEDFWFRLAETEKWANGVGGMQYVLPPTSSEATRIGSIAKSTLKDVTESAPGAVRARLYLKVFSATKKATNPEQCPEPCPPEHWTFEEKTEPQDISTERELIVDFHGNLIVLPSTDVQGIFTYGTLRADFHDKGGHDLHNRNHVGMRTVRKQASSKTEFMPMEKATGDKWGVMKEFSLQDSWVPATLGADQGFELLQEKGIPYPFVQPTGDDNPKGSEIIGTV